MPRTGAAVLTVWLLAGCTNAADGRPATTSVFAVPRLEAELQDRPAEQDRSNVIPPEAMRGDRAEPANIAVARPVDTATAVAADEVMQLLEAEALHVHVLQTEAATTDDTTASVQIRVLYGTGRGHPADAIYRVGLDLVDRAWVVTSVKATS